MTDQPKDEAVAHREALAQKRIPSTAAIFLHPIHPILVNFPIAFLTGALGSDLLYWWTRDPFFAHGSLWLIGAGLAGGLAAAATGMTDFFTIRYARQQIGGWSHFLSAITTLALATNNLLMRLDDPVGPLLPLGLLISVDTTVLLLFTGWLGGKLTFRHMIGSFMEEEEREALTEQARLAEQAKSASPSREPRSQ